MILLIFCFIILCTATDDDDDDDDFVYSKGPVPNYFYRGQRYPDRDENIECQPIKLRVARGSRRYKELVTYSGNYIHFIDSNSRIMTSRMHSRLNNLAIKYYQLYGVKILVLKTWVEYPDYSVSNTSLHYEGKCIILLQSYYIIYFCRKKCSYSCHFPKCNNTVETSSRVRSV